MDFSRRGPTVVKVHRAHSKLREQPYFTQNLIGKYQLLQSRGQGATSAPKRRSTIDSIRIRFLFEIEYDCRTEDAYRFVESISYQKCFAEGFKPFTFVETSCLATDTVNNTEVFSS